MAEITLAYSNSKESDRTYSTLNTSVGTDKYTTFAPVENFPPALRETTTLSETKRGKIHKHLKFRRKIYKIVIASNELDEAHGSGKKKDFVENFWKAPYKYISLRTGSSTWADYVEVETEVEEFPITYHDGIVYMPIITFELTAVEPE